MLSQFWAFSPGRGADEDIENLSVGWHLVEARAGVGGNKVDWVRYVALNCPIPPRIIEILEQVDRKIGR